MILNISSDVQFSLSNGQLPNKKMLDKGHSNKYILFKIYLF